MYGNTVNAVAYLLRGTAQRTVASEYFRVGGRVVVAEVFPNLLSKPIGSEYLYGNTVNAVADLLRGTAQRTAASEYFRVGGRDAVAEAFPNLLSMMAGMIFFT